MKPERILIIGGDSTIGGALSSRLAVAGSCVVCTTRKATNGAIKLDLARDTETWAPPPATTAFICAAITSQDQCRTQPAASRAVNVDGTFLVAEKLARQGTRVVFLSTNLVLAGEHPHQAADEAYSPRSEYARQKAEAEQRLLQLPGMCIVRLTKVLARCTPLLRSWSDALRQGQAIRPFADMPMAPLPLDFAVNVFETIAAARTEGIVQVSATEDITYVAAARFVAERLGASADLVQPIAAADSGLPIEYVPQYTTLDTARLRAECGLAAPSPWEAIELGMRT